jgi:prevent-host-death family protein
MPGFSAEAGCDHGRMTMVRCYSLKTIAAGVFKAKCLALLDEVQARKTKFLITKNGKPVAQLVPVEEAADSLFGFYAGKLAISGDIESVSVPPEHWKRLK